MEDRYISLFDSYTDGTLDPVSKKEFEARLLTEPVLRDDFKTYKLLKAGIRKNLLEERLTALRENIKPGTGTETSANPGGKSKSEWYKNPWIWIATLAVLSGLAWFVFFNVNREVETLPQQKGADTIKSIETNPSAIDTILQTPPSPAKPDPKNAPSGNFKKPLKSVKEENFFASAMKLYVKPSNLALILRSDTDNQQLKIDTLIREFEKGNFQIILARVPGDTDDQQLLYLRAHSLLLSGRIREASEAFNTFASDDFSTYHKESCWYRLLALYAMYPESKSELEKAINAASKFDEYKTGIGTIIKIIANR